ncbi:hypothetical protein AAVH_24341 [Aphelenchoides avenae]|nr:hypothetical protein AAVH_24341 [Aphelenchus avenae]
MRFTDAVKKATKKVLSFSLTDCVIWMMSFMYPESRSRTTRRAKPRSNLNVLKDQKLQGVSVIGGDLKKGTATSSRPAERSSSDSAFQPPRTKDDVAYVRVPQGRGDKYLVYFKGKCMHYFVGSPGQKLVLGAGPKQPTLKEALSVGRMMTRDEFFALWASSC